MQSMLPGGASHYVFEPEFCNPAAGWEKGQVEKNVRDARDRLWQVMPVFKDLEELNQWLEDRCIALWSETAHRELPGSVAPSRDIATQCTAGQWMRGRQRSLF